jgi:hypothetical protein
LGNRVRCALPRPRLVLQTAATGGGERVKLRSTAGVGRAPFRGKQALSFEPVERRKERAAVDVERAPGYLEEPVLDAVAVQRLQSRACRDIKGSALDWFMRQVRQVRASAVKRGKEGY